MGGQVITCPESPQLESEEWKGEEDEMFRRLIMVSGVFSIKCSSIWRHEMKDELWEMLFQPAADSEG